MERELCGKWMPRADTPCARVNGHSSRVKHRSAKQLASDNRKSRESRSRSLTEYQQSRMLQTTRKIWSGYPYGRLTPVCIKWVLTPSGSLRCKPLWLCSCGNTKSIAWGMVSSGSTTSCKCLANELSRDRLHISNPAYKDGRSSMVSYSSIKYIKRKFRNLGIEI